VRASLSYLTKRILSPYERGEACIRRISSDSTILPQQIDGKPFFEPQGLTLTLLYQQKKKKNKLTEPE